MAGGGKGGFGCFLEGKTDEGGEHHGERIDRQGNFDRGRTGGVGGVLKGMTGFAVAGGRVAVVVVGEERHVRRLEVAMQRGGQPEGDQQHGGEFNKTRHNGTICRWRGVVKRWGEGGAA